MLSSAYTAGSCIYFLWFTTGRSMLTGSSLFILSLKGEALCKHSVPLAFKMTCWTQWVLPTGELVSNSKRITGALQHVFYNIFTTNIPSWQCRILLNIMKAEDSGFLFYVCKQTRFFSHLFTMALSLKLQLLEFSDEEIILTGIF